MRTSFSTFRARGPRWGRAPVPAQVAPVKTQLQRQIRLAPIVALIEEPLASGSNAVKRTSGRSVE